MSSNLYSDFNGTTDKKCQPVGRQYVDISKALNQDEDKRNELCEMQRNMEEVQTRSPLDLPPPNDALIGFGHNVDKEPSGCCKK